MKMNAPDLEYTLEDIVDSNTLANVLGALAEIALGKAGHIEENWQPTTSDDRRQLRDWRTIGRRLNTLAVECQDRSL